VILLDTSVLVYSVGVDHPLRAPCRRVLETHAAGRIDAATTIAVLQEFAHIRARRRSRADAVDLTRRFAQTLVLIDVGPEALEMGMQLFARHPRLGAFDAVLAGAGIHHRVEALMSADRAFGAIGEQLRHVDPSTPALDSLLGS